MNDNSEEFLEPQLKARINELFRLSAPPQVTLELMRLLQDERTTPEQLQKLVEQDPALSAKVISLGNSSYYGLRAPVNTIARAIVIIGFRELQFLALGLGLAESFDLRQAPKDFDGQALWLHSLSVAWVANEAAHLSGLVVPGEAMLAGLLHNIGQIVLVTKFPDQYRLLMKAVASGQTYLEAEASLGFGHEMLGSVLARNWAMPQYLQDVIHGHHRPPSNAEAGPIHMSLINLALELVNRTEYRLEYERPPSDESAYWQSWPKLNRREKEKLLEKAIQTLPQMVPAWLWIMAESSPSRAG
ncbi:MAG: HDOD domain-containing protein [Candidatus Adiutrix sp.]|jgi:HD-like signal output (HDOD) protein|nr:HDOD domain-containing protein [Candidatus Adiutrix sp.]